MKLKVPEIIYVRDSSLNYPRYLSIAKQLINTALYHYKDQTISLTFSFILRRLPNISQRLSLLLKRMVVRHLGSSTLSKDSPAESLCKFKNLHFYSYFYTVFTV
jgi:hypothetical protein